MGRFHDIRYPGESAAYRQARDALLEQEIALRRQVEAVAAARRALCPGGRIPRDYIFAACNGAEAGAAVKLSELFAGGRDILVIYGFMFGADDEVPCPSCSSILDGLDGQSSHVADRINLAVVARAPAARIADWVARRGWRHLRLLSSADNSYNPDYHAEAPDGSQLPVVNVFQRQPAGIFHTWGSELLFAPCEPGQNPRHVDLIWPLWNLFDLTPAGRGTGWYPKHSYD